MAELTDIQLECKDCHQPFTFSVRDQEFYAQQTPPFENPKRCKPCRAKNKQRKQAREDQKER